MKDAPTCVQPRILIVDDNAAIHNDFRKILAGRQVAESRLDDMERALFGPTTETVKRGAFRIDSAYQGQEALGLVQRALGEDDPYVLAFVDIRMPPGWDGIETLERLWQSCPDLQAVICTAHSDYSWDDIARRLGQADSLLILKKPFDTAEVLQIAHALTQKWALARRARLRLEDLDRMVHERTQALQQEMEERLSLEAQLRQSQKLEAVGCLAAGIAHEFNNLLTVIQGHASMLSTKALSSNGALESIERIAQASQRAASLTRRLLAFSRKQPVQLKPIDLSTAAQSLTKMLGQLIGERYQLELNCAPNLPVVLADEANIEQVLINLALNARDAMEDGGTIRVATSFVELDAAAAKPNLDARPGRFVCLTVADSGCGMTREVLGRIFDPFYTTKDVGKGTGLGLSTVHGIVQQHQGWIEVSSQVGRGSTFRVFLPAGNEAGKTAPTERQAGTASVVPGGGEAVLMVEDEGFVREAARLALQGGGYRVFEAGDGPQALEVWEHCPARIDLLVTDMVMPHGVSGGTLARVLQARDPRLQVLYTSGYSSEVIREDRHLIVGVNFLRKPYDSASLLRAVRLCLDTQGPARVSGQGRPAEAVRASSAAVGVAVKSKE